MHKKLHMYYTKVHLKNNRLCEVDYILYDFCFLKKICATLAQNNTLIYMNVVFQRKMKILEAGTLKSLQQQNIVQTGNLT
jgi:hypothetical protein